MLTMHDEDEPSGEALALPQFGMRSFSGATARSSSTCPTASSSRCCGRCGFTVEALHELQAPEGATSRHTYVTPEWAQRWPSEEIWVARLADAQERSSAVA